MTGRRRRAGIVLAVLVVTAGSLSPPAAADEPPELVSVEVRPSEVDVTTGFGAFVVDVTLTDPEGLPDVIDPHSLELWPYHAVLAPSTSGGEVGYIGWKSLTRVSGTPQAGVWRGVTEVSPAWSEHYTVHSVVVLDCFFCQPNDPGHFTVTGPPLTVTGVRSWVLDDAGVAIKVVTGQEPWTPRARVLSRTTGAPIPGAWVTTRGFYGGWDGLARQRTAPGVRVGPDGVWTATRSMPVVRGMSEQDYAVAYGARGTRGWSLEAAMTLRPRIKWQANSRYSVTSGRTVTVTGNFFPAPSVLGQTGTGPNIHLQRLSPTGVWQTVATTRGRDNGRYSLTWASPGGGTAQLRIRLPGRALFGATYVGTNLAPTVVTF